MNLNILQKVSKGPSYITGMLRRPPPLSGLLEVESKPITVYDCNCKAFHVENMRKCSVIETTKTSEALEQRENQHNPTNDQRMTNKSYRTNLGQLLSPPLHAQWNRTSSISVYKPYYLIFESFLSPTHNRSLKGGGGVLSTSKGGPLKKCSVLFVTMFMFLETSATPYLTLPYLNLIGIQRPLGLQRTVLIELVVSETCLAPVRYHIPDVCPMGIEP